MIPGLITVIGVSVVSFLLFYFANSIKEDQPQLRLLAIIVAFALLALIPKTVLDNQNHCNLVVVNQSTQQFTNGSLVNLNTTYVHDYVCESSTNNTPRIFWNSYLGWLLAFAAVLFIIFNSDIVEFLKNLLRRSR